LEKEYNAKLEKEREEAMKLHTAKLEEFEKEKIKMAEEHK